MGNTQSGSLLTRTGGALDSFVAELGADVVYERRSVLLELLRLIANIHIYLFL